MGIYVDLFLGNISEPETYSDFKNRGCPMSSLNTIKLASLFAILQKLPDDCELINKFELIYSAKGADIYKIPEIFLKKLSLVKDSSLSSLAHKWIITSEFVEQGDWEIEIVAGFLHELRNLSLEAIRADKSLLLRML